MIRRCVHLGLEGVPGVKAAVVLVVILSWLLPTRMARCQSSGYSRPDGVRTAVPNGTLMIVGGRAGELKRHFVELAGGTGATVACVPTAVQFNWLLRWCRKLFRQADVPRKNRIVVHTRDRETANSESFVKPIREADAVWFTGGRQWRLAKVYGGTKTMEAFWGVLERGGVIGGSSAGASIQGSFLVRGDPATKRIVVGKYQNGFGFLPRSAIDQHLLARNRQYALIDVIEERRELLGIGVDERTAAVVRGDTLSVVGESVVAIYDARRWEEGNGEIPLDEKYFFLRDGARFDLRTRTVLSGGNTTE